MYDITRTPDGGVEIDPETLLAFTITCLDQLHRQMSDAGKTATAVAISAFWHSCLGVGADGGPTTPILHLFDTRSREQVKELRKQFDPEQIRERTGAVLHTSYWPAKLLWFKETQPANFERTAQWISFGDYLFRKLHGKSAESLSMVSGSGLWKQHDGDYDMDLLRAAGIRVEQLASINLLDKPVVKLLPEYAKRWPLLDGIPWCPAYGDGACDSIGSGCANEDRFVLMIGTSGAMRVVVNSADAITIPSGLWCYRADRKRFVLGGSLSNGGEVYRWATRTLNLPPDPERHIAGRRPGTHGLTVLPYLMGERSPYWRSDLRGAITGITIATTPLDILQAALEGVSLLFKQIYSILTQTYPVPREVVASGGALLASKTWVQMMTEAIGRPIVTCLEQEASSRGAALIAAEQLGMIDSLDDVSMTMGEKFSPDPQNTKIYNQMLSRDLKLFHALFES
jgi:gluconokinase